MVHEQHETVHTPHTDRQKLVKCWSKIKCDVKYGRLSLVFSLKGKVFSLVMATTVMLLAGFVYREKIIIMAGNYRKKGQ